MIDLQKPVSRAQRRLWLTRWLGALGWCLAIAAGCLIWPRSSAAPRALAVRLGATAVGATADLMEVARGYVAASHGRLEPKEGESLLEGGAR